MCPALYIVCACSMRLKLCSLLGRLPKIGPFAARSLAGPNLERRAEPSRPFGELGGVTPQQKNGTAACAVEKCFGLTPETDRASETPVCAREALAVEFRRRTQPSRFSSLSQKIFYYFTS